MSDKNDNMQDTIDLQELFLKLKAKRKLFVKVVCVAFVLSTAWILPEPRTYTTTVTLAPEVSSLAGGGALGDLAENFGFDLGTSQSADALYPTLYPDIIESTTFAISLFDVRVKNLDGDIDTTYYHYLDKKQKYSFWKWPIRWVSKQISSLTASPEVAPSAANGDSQGKKYNEFFYSKRQDAIINMIHNKIKCSVDKKTDVITFTVEDQDRLISATMADSISQRLQDYIIDYRTRKAKVDVEYYANMVKEAKKEYELALSRYSGYSDAHFDSYLQSTQSKREALNNDVQMKLSTYNTVSAQYQTALAKLQERTPSFTIIQPAVVPQKPSGPKRIIFIIAITFLSALFTTVWVLRKELLHYFTH